MERPGKLPQRGDEFSAWANMERGRPIGQGGTLGDEYFPNLLRARRGD
jgi:hypothetical protein